MNTDALNLPHPVPDRKSDLATLITRFAYYRDMTALSPLRDYLHEQDRLQDLRDLDLIVGKYLAQQCVGASLAYWASWLSHIAQPVTAVFWFDLYSPDLTAQALEAENSRSSKQGPPSSFQPVNPVPMQPDRALIEQLRAQQNQGLSSRMTDLMTDLMAAVDEPSPPEPQE